MLLSNALGQRAVARHCCGHKPFLIPWRNLPHTRNTREYHRIMIELCNYFDSLLSYVHTTYSLVWLAQSLLPLHCMIEIPNRTFRCIKTRHPKHFPNAMRSCFREFLTVHRTPISEASCYKGKKRPLDLDCLFRSICDDRPSCMLPGYIRC